MASSGIMLHFMKSKVCLAVTSHWFRRLFSDQDLKRSQAFVDWNSLSAPEDPGEDFLTDTIGDAQVVVTSWGTAAFTGRVLKNAPHLKLVVHAGGTIKPLVTPEFWRRDLRVSSAASAISYGVAEYCLGLMLTAGKRAFWAGRSASEGAWKEPLAHCFGGPVEFYQQNVGVIGCGFVGRQLIKLLGNFACRIHVFDPYLTEEKAKELGVTKVDDLRALFSECKMISLNAPVTEQTVGMIGGEHFAQLQPGSVFINTARGTLVRQEEMVEELRKGKFVACLDVTDPEPCPLDHPLRRLPNVWLTPHIAGGNADNLLRIGSFVIDEIERFTLGRELQLEVKEEQLAHIG